MPRLAPRVFLVVVGVVVLLAPPAAAERSTSTRTGGDDPPTSTTSTTAATPPPSTSSTSTTSTTVSPDDPGAGGDIPGGRVPPAVEVPPPVASDAGPHERSVAIVGDLGDAQARLDAAEALVTESQARVADLARRLVGIDRRIVVLTDEERQSVKRVESAREALNDRAVEAYMRGNLGGLGAGLGADDPNELGRNSTLMASVLDADDRAVDEYRAARRSVSSALVDLAEERQSVTADLSQAKGYEKAVRRDALDARVQFLAFEAGSEIFVTGMVFPVGDPHDFIDSWMAPRSGGRQHQGVDIFAPSGTDLYAVERGVVTNVGTNSLGGTKLWVYGESGTTYYYAHLLAYAPGLVEGMVVSAGDLVGFVGNTGNAATTPSHVHFEIHPHNGPAVNPTPLLRVVDSIDDGREDAV